MNLTIKKADTYDAKEIALLGAKTFDQSFGHLFRNQRDIQNYLELTYSEKKIYNSLQKEKNVFWIVKDDQKPVGYAKLQLDASTEFIKNDKVCKLQKLYMIKGTSSKGIGSKLQQIIFEEARLQEYQYLWLSVLKENTRAIEFYKRHEYKIVGEHPFVIGREHFIFWVMAIEL